MPDITAVVVGGGIIGLATAYHLAVDPSVRVVVLEKDVIGSGASGQSNACIRSNYNHPVLTAMAVESMRRMAAFADEFGADPGFQQTGYMAVVDPVNEAAARHSVDLQRRAGAATRFLSADEAGQLVPWMATADLAGAIYEAEAGTVEPSFVLDGIAAAARRRGVEIRSHTRATAIVAATGRRPGVRVGSELLEADLVLNAAGAWAPALQPADAPPLPVTVYRHQVGLLERPASLSQPAPIVVDMVNELSFRPDTGGIVRVGAASRSGPGDRIGNPDRYRRGIDADRLALYAELTIRRFPRFAEGGFRQGYSAFLDITPDSQFLLGPVAGFDGYHIAAGMSGHGFKHGLLIGLGMAEQMLNGGTDAFPIDLFSPTRFDRAEPITPARQYTRGKGHLGARSDGGEPID